MSIAKGYEGFLQILVFDIYRGKLFMLVETLIQIMFYFSTKFM